MKKYFWLFLAPLVIFNCLGGWRTEPLGDDEGIILFNDGGDAAIKAKANHPFAMAGSGSQLKKVFDLTQLPAEWRNNIGSAALRMYCVVADQSRAVKKLPQLNGFTEEIVMELNGERTVIPTGSDLWSTSSRWRDIPLSAEAIKGDSLEVVFHKINSPTNDDYFYVHMDSSAEQTASTFSLDNGKTFVKQTAQIPQYTGEFMVRLIVYRGKDAVSIDFSQPDAAKLVDLENGAVIEDGVLKLDGWQSQAVIRDSASFNITTRGLTIAGVMKMTGNVPGGKKKDHNMLFTHKDSSWFLGRTGSQINLSFCQPNAENYKWNRALFGGDYPDLEVWFHLAAVFERVSETAQGNVGYNVKLYLNGELAGERFFLNSTPNLSQAPVIIGNGFPLKDPYGFCGEIASVDIIAKGLNAGEIDTLMKKSDRISKLPPGFFEQVPATKAALDKALAAATSPQAKWLVKGLARAASTGFNQKTIAALLAKNAKLLASQATGEELARAWNSQNSEFTVIPGGDSLLLVANGQGASNSPVLGLFNPVTGDDIFDGRATGWMLNFDGRQVHDRSHGVKYAVSPVEMTADGGKFQVVWTHAGNFEAISNFTFANGRLEQSFEVKNLRDDVLLTSVAFPRYFIRELPSKKNWLIFPSFSGIVYEQPFHSFGQSGLYPSAHSAMQFVGCYDDQKNGVYLAFEETDGSYKTQTVSGRSDIIEYKWDNPVAKPLEGTGGNGFTSAGNAVVQAYRGGWFEAGQLYKHFVESKAPWAVTELPRQDTPAWYRDNCLWLAGSPGQGTAFEYLRDYFELPYAIWFCRWQKVDAGEDPFLVVHENAKEPIARLRAKDIYLQPYLNSRLYGFVEENKFYIDRLQSKAVQENASRQQNGALYLENYGENFAVMCPATKLWQEELVRMAKVVDEGNLNGCYFDQLPCSSPRLCFAKNHGHAPGDPCSWSEGYRAMLRTLRKNHPNLGLDGEDNNEIYANTLDGYMSWRFTQANHVALFQSVYGGGRTQFTSRGFDAFGGVGTYPAGFAKLGEQFVNGEQIGWLHIFDVLWATPVRSYAKRLAHLRRALLGYLNAADMLAPLEFTGEVPTLSCYWGGPSNDLVTTDKIRSCAWKRMNDGRILVLFTNTAEEPVTVSPATRYPGYDKLAVCKQGEDVRYLDLSKDALPQVSLAPYASEIWLLGPDFDKAEAEKIGETTKLVATFTDNGQSIPFREPIFTVRKELKAEPDKWFTANDFSWAIFAFKNFHPSVGNDPRGRNAEEDKGNWFQASPGAIINYGEIDFGEKSPKFLELRLAIGKENAGGKISLVDITGNYTPDRTLAEYTTECTGGWFTWKNIQIPIAEVTGKHAVVFKVEGKDVNFRSWRLVW